MSSYPLISVLVPVYKPPLQYLKKCCEGIFNQTYPNLEVLFYIDGTADECPETMTYLRSIEDEHDNVRIYIGIKNMGVSYARNYLKSQISNEAYAYVYTDSDDEMDSKNILLRYELMKEKDLDAVFSEFIRYTFTLSGAKNSFWRYTLLPAEQFKDALLLGCSWWASIGANPFLRNNKKIKEIDYPVDFKYAEDLHYGLNLIWKANIKFDIIHEPLYYQYAIWQNPDSLTTFEKKVNTKLVINGAPYPFYFTCYKDFWEEHGYTFNNTMANIYARIHNYGVKYISVLKFPPEEITMLNKMVSTLSTMTGKSKKHYLDLIMETAGAERGHQF